MNIGDKVPDLLGLDAQGHEVKRSDFPGQPVIIYFYPKDMTPGCTAEACSFRDNYQSFRSMGYGIVGVSADSSDRHKKFIEKNELPFPLVADTDHKLCELFGVWRLKKMAGREYMGIVRTTFVVSTEGVITDKIEKVNTKNASEQLFELLDGRNSPNP